MPSPTREVRVESAGTVDGLSIDLVRRAVVAVLDGEDAGPAIFNVTFLSGQRMRVLNRRTFGRDRATDVIAFDLPHAGCVVGDIYVCPSVARRTAREFKLSEKEEMVRLVIHGVLHALGFDHAGGAKRMSSLMWRTQEGYVRLVLEGER